MKNFRLLAEFESETREISTHVSLSAAKRKVQRMEKYWADNEAQITADLDAGIEPPPKQAWPEGATPVIIDRKRNIKYWLDDTKWRVWEEES